MFVYNMPNALRPKYTGIIDSDDSERVSVSSFPPTRSSGCKGDIITLTGGGKKYIYYISSRKWRNGQTRISIKYLNSAKNKRTYEHENISLMKACTQNSNYESCTQNSNYDSGSEESNYDSGSEEYKYDSGAEESKYDSGAEKVPARIHRDGRLQALFETYLANERLTDFQRKFSEILSSNPDMLPIFGWNDGEEVIGFKNTDKKGYGPAPSQTGDNGGGKNGGKNGRKNGRKNGGWIPTQKSILKSWKILPLDGQTFLIYGKCQQGKASFLIETMSSHLVYSNCTSVIILRNCKADNKQLKSRFDDFRSQVEELTGNKKESSFNYIYTGDKSVANRRAMYNALSGKTPSIIVAIANKTQMNTLTEVINKTRNPRYALAIDEADQVAYGDPTVDFRKLMSVIIEKAGRTYTTSATNFSIMFTDDQIKSANVIVMTTPENYKGMHSIETHALNTIVKPITNNNSLFKNDDNLIPVLKHLMRKSSPNADDYNPFMKHDQPIIILIKSTNLNSIQLKLANYIMGSQELDKWEGIVYNSKGVYIFSRHLKKFPNMLCSRKKGIHVKCAMPDGNIHVLKNCLLFTDTTISSGIQYFYDLKMSMGVRQISHMFIISGNLADRGISFVSENYKWHLSHMYYVPSSTATVAHIIQSAGRLCGRFSDSMPLCLYAPIKVIEDLIKGIKIQDDIFGQLRSKYSGMLMKTIKKIPVCIAKVPIRDLCSRKEAKISKKQTVLGEDGGYNSLSYSKAIDGIKKGTYTIQDLSVQHKKPDVNNCTEDIKENDCVLIPVSMTNYKEITEQLQKKYGLNTWGLLSPSMSGIHSNFYKKVWNKYDKNKHRVVSSSTKGLIVRMSNRKLLECKINV
jgi:hypothetical protein